MMAHDRSMASTVHQPIRLVAIDDDREFLEIIRDALSVDEYEIHLASDPRSGLDLVYEHAAQIVLLDYHMPGMDGLEVLDEIVARDPSIDVYLLTGEYSTDAAVAAIQRGASDYLTKPLPLDVLRTRVGRSADEIRRKRIAFSLDGELLETFQLEGIVGRSPVMLNLFAQIRRVAPHFRSALITGQSGTGKELVARALHRLSPTPKAPFVACNCAGLVETLMETELFGYTKGAFTGAAQDKMGLFEFASGGTVFLDEIGEMSMSGQAKLLRVLQNQEVQRVGSPLARPVKVRVIAATNRNLRELVVNKTFREDLYYRLAMVEVQIPPLSDRREDLPLLERHLINKFSSQFNKPITGITRRAQNLLARHSWPGNVRELENVIGNACMMSSGTFIDIHDLPGCLSERNNTPEEDEEKNELLSFDELQRKHALMVLGRVGGNKVRAAEILGVSRTTLYSLLAK